MRSANPVCLFVSFLMFAQSNIKAEMPPIKNTQFAARFSEFPADKVTDMTPVSRSEFFSCALPELDWRHSNHFYTFEAGGVFNTVSGRFTLSIESVDKDGKVLDAQPVFTSDDLQGKSEWSSPPLAITKAQPDNRNNRAVTARLVTVFDQWTGTFKVSSFRALPFKLSEEQRQLFFSPGKPDIAAAQSWDVGYTPAGSTPDTIADTLLKLIRTAGIEKMRVQAIWGELIGGLIQGGTMPAGQNPALETVKGKYGFEYVDSLLDEADWYGIGVAYMTIHGTPGWVSSKTRDDLPEDRKKYENAFFPPDDWADYEKFVAALVSHFKGRIPAYEVWSEFDAPHYGLIGGIDAYKNYLKRFYQTAKQIDPQVRIIMGRPNYYLAPLLRDGYAGYCDEISLHPYPGRGGTVESSFLMLDQMQTVLYANKVYDKKINISEVGFGAGWSWAGPGGQDGETAKARRTRELLDRFGDWTHEICLYLPSWTERRYGWMQYAHNDRLNIMPVYYEIGNFTGKLNMESRPVVTEATVPDSGIKRGEPTAVELMAKNISDHPQRIRFWPVGFVPSLGCDRLEDIRRYDWDGLLQPGEVRRQTICINASESAFGNYSVGIAVICDEGNSLSMAEVKIRDISRDATVSVSGTFSGDTANLNDLNLPVWGGDFDTPWVEWPVEKQSRTESVVYEFPKTVNVTGFECHWVENLEPQKPLEAGFKGEREGLRHPYGKYLKPQKIVLEYLNDETGTWQVLPFCDVPSGDISRQHHITVGTIANGRVPGKLRLSFEIPEGRPAGLFDFVVKGEAAGL